MKTDAKIAFVICLCCCSILVYSWLKSVFETTDNNQVKRKTDEFMQQVYRPSNHATTDFAIAMVDRLNRMDSAFYFITLNGGEYMVDRNSHVIYKIINNGYKPIPIDSLTDYMK